MKWIITHDYINGSSEPMSVSLGLVGEPPVTVPAVGNAVGRNSGDKRNTPALVAEYARDLPHAFQLLDDDGNLYFEGRCADLSQYDGDSAFEPLDYVGEAYGCTTMTYRPANDTNAVWKHL